MLQHAGIGVAISGLNGYVPISLYTIHCMHNTYVDGNYYDLNISSKTAEIRTQVDQSQKFVIVPSTVSYDGSSYMVNAIGTRFCRNNEILTSLTIPANIFGISDKAFSRCNNLSSVTCYAEEPPSLSENSFTHYGTLHVLSGLKDIYANATRWKNFNIVDDISTAAGDGDIYISDDEYSFSNAEIKNCTSLTYTRTFDNTSWQPLYVPFYLNYASIVDKCDIACLNAFHEYDDDNNGTIDRMILEALPVNSGILLPNHPYLIRARQAGIVELSASSPVIYPTEENTFECSTFTTQYNFIGSYNSLTTSELNSLGAYVLDDEGNLSPVSDLASDLSLGAFRWYMVPKSNNGFDVNAANDKEISLLIKGENGTTGIDLSTSDRQPISIYNLSGQMQNHIKMVCKSLETRMVSSKRFL